MLTLGVRYTPRLSEGERTLLALPSRLNRLDTFARVGLEPITVAMLKRHWETKGAAFGHPWRPLAPSTIASKARRGTLIKGPLRDSDTLYRAVFSPATRRVLLTPSGVRLALTPNDPKWLWHQLGTSRMPARQVIPQPLPRSYTASVRDAVADYLATGRTRGAAGRFVAFAASAQ